MGIKGLKQFLRNKFPSVLVESHLSQYRGKKAAIDILPYLYKYKVTYGDAWLQGLASFLQNCMVHEVHVTVLFDGPCVGKEKDREHEKRQESRTTLRNKMEQLILDLDAYQKNGTVTEQLEFVSGKKSNHRSLLLGTGGRISVDTVTEYIETLRKQMVTISSADRDLLQELCRDLNLTFLYAESESESYGSYLCRSGQVDLVITEDTDVLAYGCPLWISSILPNGSCTEIVYNEVLAAMSITTSQFLDFCISCGTDYNESEKGVGPVGAYKSVRNESNKSNVRNEIRTLFLNPCTYAVYSKSDASRIPVCIRYNDIFIKESIFSKWTLRGISLSVVKKWIRCYESRFECE